MAALRQVESRVVTPKALESFLRKKRTLKRRGKPGLGPSALPGKSVIYKEVVATSPEEAASGLFTQVGELLVLVPERVEDALWQRVRTMDHPENKDLWYHPYYGIKAALKAYKWRIPEPHWKGMSNFPAGILELSYHTIQEEGRDKISQEVTSEPTLERRRPYESFVRDIWIPLWLYSGKGDRKGKFLNTKRAQAVAAAFGITVDKYARSSSWFRSATPEITEESERSITVPEDTFQDMKQRIISDLEVAHARGESTTIDWAMMSTFLQQAMGIKAAAFQARLKAEVEAELPRILSSKREYDENRPRAYPLSSKP